MQTKSREQLNQEKRKFWKAHIQAWQKSGYSLSEYGKRNNLIYHRLIYWKAKFGNELGNPVSFVPVPLQPACRPESPLILSLQNERFKIEIGANFSDQMLGRLIVTLELL